MEIIPVLDVKCGLVVAARGGERASYAPVSQEPAGSAPDLILKNYLSLYSFRSIYLADLDGIEGRGPDLATVEECVTRFPNLAFWVDNGGASIDALTRLVSIGEPVVPVLGTESGLTFEDLGRISAALNGRFALSIDYRGDDFLGDPAILNAPKSWPDKIIVMTLARVGMKRGPDLAKISRISGLAGARSVYAAGGIRGLEDLRHVRRAGCAGALVATALHSGQIKTGDLEEAAGF